MAVDYDLLGRVGNTRWVRSTPSRGWRPPLGPTGWLPSASQITAVREADAVLQWFACPLGPILAARLLGKRSVVVSGGYDVAFLPAIGYGRMVERRTRWMGILCLTLADRVLAFSEFSSEEIRRHAPRARVSVAHLGLDVDRYSVPERKEPLVLTVGAVCSTYAQRKGLDTFARVSRMLPDIPFVLAGSLLEESVVAQLRDMGGSNLAFVGHLEQDHLLRLFGRAAVYVQCSLHEGFGYAVTEAMLRQCTPVVSRAGALPEVVGDCGYVVPPGSIAETAAAITQALRAPRGERARERVVERFSLPRRERHLIDAFGDLL